MRTKSMPIYSAILKHGHSNFCFSILEYCEPYELLIREKDYIYFLEAEYNIIQDPTLPPMSNRTHSEETQKKMSDSQKKIDHSGRFRTGENNPNFGKTLSDETRNKISDIHKEIDHSGRFKTGQSRVKGAGKPSQPISVTDSELNIITNYNSIHEAARALNIKASIISKYFANNQQKPYKGRYTFKK
jgi:group I intron endonuclease